MVSLVGVMVNAFVRFGQGRQQTDRNDMPDHQKTDQLGENQAEIPYPLAGNSHAEQLVEFGSAFRRLMSSGDNFRRTLANESLT